MRLFSPYFSLARYIFFSTMIYMSGKIFGWALIIFICSTGTARALALEKDATGNGGEATNPAIQQEADHGAGAKVLWESVESQEATAAISGHALSETTTWLFLFTGIISCALAGFIIVRSPKRETVPADEYAIIEDIIESADD
ncbi:MAG: hypothetical protein A3D65_03725 [Candidatus Lloydbacteria bacterium RIFCSPHIGHO2_02_FULL_50_13]|uniref:Uncharacterized protein n=1 Tax=Candidatus Lloydbacteria bacterium RIFCSPHIGHO2_02_FULL_50_13 TaxID=1798661 RepID=A0A1G2D1U5_9BACT|nr:MAG: hypothetical protein A3D65_03725 [Candidatus Lloydbacteria bacterium RIFCSPHIGHO2_02_FULL_50_13]